MLKTHINNWLKNNIDNTNSVAILFSGGMDSLTILLSCLELGIKPVLYTFYLDNYVSEDIKQSRYISELYNLELKEIEIKTQNIDLYRDVKYIVEKYNVRKKTAVQCIHPFLYVIPDVKEDIILSGLCADDLYGTPRSVSKHQNTSMFNEIRKDKFFDKKSSSYEYIKILCEENDKKFIAPYKQSRDIYNYFISKNYKELNSPKQKNVAYLEYQNQIDKYKLYRRNSNLQCNSKIREWHDSLLKDDLINYRNNISITGIYNNIYNDLLKK